MKNSPKSPSAKILQYAENLPRGFSVMDYDRKIQPQGHIQLIAEDLNLSIQIVAAPMEVNPYFAYRDHFPAGIPFQHLKFLPPVVLELSRVQSQARKGVLRKFPAERKHRVPHCLVSVRHHNFRNPGLNRPPHGSDSVSPVCGIIKMSVCIYKIQHSAANLRNLQKITYIIFLISFQFAYPRIEQRRSRSTLIIPSFSSRATTSATLL